MHGLPLHRLSMVSTSLSDMCQVLVPQENLGSKQKSARNRVCYLYAAISPAKKNILDLEQVEKAETTEIQA